MLGVYMFHTMTQSNQTNDHPGNWEPGARTTQGDTYTQPFYNPHLELSIDVYYDDKGDDQHHVVLRNENTHYPVNSYKYDTEKEAMDKADDIMEKTVEHERGVA